jgi:hypothetical protein
MLAEDKPSDQRILAATAMRSLHDARASPSLAAQ